VKTYLQWIDKIGVGKVEWSRTWARVPNRRRITNEFMWVYDLKLTSKIGGHHVSYLRTSIADLSLEHFPPALMDEITATYAEFLLNDQRAVG
jgi:hypothetical protein